MPMHNLDVFQKIKGGAIISQMLVEDSREWLLWGILPERGKGRCFDFGDGRSMSMEKYGWKSCLIYKSYKQGCVEAGKTPNIMLHQQGRTPA